MRKKDLKQAVKDKYSEIAEKDASCCPSGECAPSAGYTVFNQDYESLEGYFQEADLGLGCGLPTEFANIKKGDLVLDLGSGAGNDCFVAARLTGEEGRIIGIDFSEAMVKKANENARKLGLKHVRFFKSDIEEMKVPSFAANVVISNCVLNLVPDKKKAFAEIYRVLKGNGHFSISDIVLDGELPEKIKNALELYCGCVSGAMQKNKYLRLIKETGFVNIQVQKETPYLVPDTELLKYLRQEELDQFRSSGAKVLSIQLCGEKAATCCCCEQ